MGTRCYLLLPHIPSPPPRAIYAFSYISSHPDSQEFKKNIHIGLESVGSGVLRQMSECPISHGGQYHSCILRRWRPAFLHPKGEIQICHRADEQNALKIVSPPPITVLTKLVHPRKPRNPWPMRKNYLAHVHKNPSLHLCSEPPAPLCWGPKLTTPQRNKKTLKIM
jgi:hypothetical protein